ncbi:MAG TPA: hypothetical protein PKD96_03310, partial [Candidatus Absconditabacterales bacterium]|nr:hypothetical protein [Candidatus Absconditabacterales bacterium]
MKFDDIKRQIFSDLSKDEIQELISVLILETTKEHSFPTAQELDRVNFNMTESPIKRITLSPIVNKAEIVFIKKYFHLFEDLETL